MNGKELENFEKIENYYKSDIILRQMLDSLSPYEKQFENLKEIKQYVQVYIDTLERIENEFDNILNDFKQLRKIKKNIQEIIKQCKNRLLDCNYNIKVIEEIHYDCLMCINDDLVSAINKECMGYNDNEFSYGLFDKCESINELLKVIHEFVLNNELYVEEMPLIDKRYNENRISYYIIWGRK